MRMRRVKTLIALLVSIAGSTASADGAGEHGRSRDIAAGADAVRSAVVDLLASHDIALEAQDAESGSITGSTVGIADPALAVCSQPAWAEKDMDFVTGYEVRIDSVGAATQRVTIEVEYIQQRWSMTKDDIYEVPCDSTGTFEDDFLDELVQTAQ